MSSRKLIILIISFALAYIFAEGLFPTPNVVGGGEAKMFLLIFLTVGFKVVIEFILNRRRKKGEEKHVQGPLR
jgi:Flp pilus assembly protein protease CpaA